MRARSTTAALVLVLAGGLGSATPGPAGGAEPTAEPARPNTVLMSKPDKQTRNRKGKFRFTSTVPGSVFECSINRRPLRACTSPFKVKGRIGRNFVIIRASDGVATHDRTPIRYRWRVLPPRRRSR